MKSYLELASISARVRRRQSRMTRLGIALAVFLVTAIFGMADMEITSQRAQTVQQYGAWHGVIKGGISDEEAVLIGSRPEVVHSGWYGAKNTRLDSDFMVDGQRVAVCGADEGWLALFPGVTWLEGVFPAESGTVSMTRHSKELLGARLGDTVTVTFPEGDGAAFRVTGFFSDTAMMNEQDSAGLLFNSADYRRYFSGYEGAEQCFYFELTPFCSMRRVFSEIQAGFQLTDEQLGRNPKLLGLSGQSDDSYMRILYGAAAVLTVLVVTSGVLMVTGSLNSSVAQRTEFFGLLRCLGATPKQVRKFVRREAFGWCRASIPLGLLGGTALCWALCEILRLMTPTYFGTLPRFGFSPLALVCGAAVGSLTVLLAARAPARKASAVPPLVAVSGNAGTVQAAKKAANTRFFRVETALGIHHATGNRRNFVLMAGSFAFSILLFLAFSATVDFMHHAINPLRPSAPDLSIFTEDQTCSIPVSLAEEIAAQPMVKRVYGRGFAYGLAAEAHGEPLRVDLVSYEEQQFRWAEGDLLAGELSEAENGKGVLAVFRSGSALQAGDFLTLNGRALPVSGVLGDSPFDSDPGVETIFCSETLFRQLTGETGYTILDVQLRRGAGSEAAAELRALAGEGYRYSDRLLSNREARGAFYSYALFVYGFLAVIALIAVFHIVNSISMSVSARMRQYGAMRAIGMEPAQLTRMVAAEAMTYVLGGLLFGTLAGLPLHRLLFTQIISSQWGDPWEIPWVPLLIIVLVMLGAAVASIAAPARRIREMSVTETIVSE